MIKNINGNKYIQVSGGTSSNPYISPGSVGAGMMRYNPNMNCIEVNDGNSWQQLPAAHPIISLTPEAESLLDWARHKRDEESRIAALAAKHPTVADALQAVAVAEEQVKIVAALVDNA